MQFDIRTMQKNDVEGVVRLSFQLGYSPSIDETAVQIEAVLSRCYHTAFVATNSNEIIGWVHAFESLHIESLPFIEIGGLVVDETYRGVGIGKALIGEVQKWCVKKNFHFLRVRSQHKRLEAHRFYSLLGFREIKEQKVFQLKLSIK